MLLPSVEDHSAAPVVRLIRRICLLREQGDLAGAQDLERSQLAAAVEAARGPRGAEFLPDDELRRIFQRESERAAEAVALAGLLLEQLSPRWPAAAPERAADGAAGRRGPAAAAPRPAGTPAIPDLLDAMLAYDSRARRA